jgi:hypothetical protein
MLIIGYNFDSLKRHRVTPALIDEVLEGSMVSYFAIEDDKHGDRTCEMVVGFTMRDRLLEIGLRYESKTEAFVFHAQTASPHFRALFEKEWNNG